MHCVFSVIFFWNNIFISTENQLSYYGRISYGVLQGSFLGPFLFLSMICLKLWNQTCFYKDVQEIEKVLINDFENNCDWLAEIKLTINFGEDKSKSILSAIQRKIENISKKA